MKRNKRLTILAFAAMLIMALCATLISFSFANEGGDIDTSLELATTSGTTHTNIDYIIMNSNDEELTAAQRMYNIVEITSGNVSDLSVMSKNDASGNSPFKSYVVDGHATVSELMAAGKVNYKSYTAAEITDNNKDALAVVSQADLIYIHNDLNSAFGKTNDLNQNLYDLIRSYATSDYKPLIIDGPKKNSGGGGGSVTSDTKISTVIKDYYGPMGMYYYTFDWDTSTFTTADSFFDSTISATSSLYLPINGNDTKKNWKYYKDSTDKVNTVASILVLRGTDPVITSGTPSSGKLIDKILTGSSTYLSGDYYISDADGNVSTTDKFTNLYEVDPAGVINNKMYNQRYSDAIPKYIDVKEINIADYLNVDTSGYDMIVIEDTANVTITPDIYDKLVATMYGKKHIVYDVNLASLGTGSGTGSGSNTNNNDSNYDQFYTDILDNSGKSAYDNIMITNETNFKKICNANDATGATPISDLINASTYRGNSGSSSGGGSSSSVYTVLEIQPCYPIDTTLATSESSYYDQMCNIVNNKTIEEITDDPATNTTEYYAWEISKAKIAYALGIPESQIRVVHMSSEEFKCNKQEIVGNYDMIYIGSNTTALKAASERRSIELLRNSNGSNTIGADPKAYPVYSMYTHNGDPVNLYLRFLAQDGTKIAYSGRPFAASPFDLSATTSSGSTFTVMNGNDISYNNLRALNDFVDSGLPVVIDKDLTAAYELAASDKYDQYSLDPDSNMFKFLNYALGGTTTKKNVLKNFDKTAVQKVKCDADLGTTLTGYQTVFDATGSTNLKKIYNTNKKRPKLSIVSSPVQYSSYDDSTRLTDRTLKFKFEVAGYSKYTANFYIDDNGNSLFTDDGVYKGATKSYDIPANSTDTVSSFEVSLGDFKGGPVYWKFEVVTADGVVSTTGLSFIAPAEGDKKDVNVLQIVPNFEAAQGQGSTGAQGVDSLYFCPDCQRANIPLVYNPFLDQSARNNQQALWGGNYADRQQSKYYTGWKVIDGYAQGVYMGRHKHRFGIVEYDNTYQVMDNGAPNGVVGADDWDTNLADEVAYLYNFDIDIIDTREFEAWAEAVNTEYPAGISATDKKAKISSHKSNIEGETGLKKQYNNAVAAREEKEAELDAILARMAANAKNKGGTCNTGYSYEYEFERLSRLKCYYEYFYLVGGNSYQGSKNKLEIYLSAGDNYEKSYQEYARLVDAELEAKEAYYAELRLANPDNWMKEIYDTVIIGPSEAFAGDDIKTEPALDALETYVSNGGQTLIFHDTLSRFSDAGAAKLTERMISYFGNDVHNMEMSASANSGTYLVPYTAKSEPEKYFFTNLNCGQGGTDFYGIQKYLSAINYTDGYAIAGNNDGGNVGASPYKYATGYNWDKAAFWDNDAKNTSDSGTDRATQNNKGIITMYPFSLPDKLNTAGTHIQAYPVDVESDNMTVWYSLSAGTTRKNKVCNSIFAASPNDGVDNYFIYSYGNVYYCGAGHSKVTGPGKDNNDERRLYLNIICNSVRASVKQPSIDVYDYKTTKNDKITRDKTKTDVVEYVYPIDDKVVYPEFSYLATLDQEDDIISVDIYYKKDITTGSAYKDGEDYKIITLDKTKSPKNVLINIGSDVGETFKLKPEYFTADGGNSAYIVIAVTTNKGTQYVRIRLEKKDPLFNMT